MADNLCYIVRLGLLYWLSSLVVNDSFDYRTSVKIICFSTVYPVFYERDNTISWFWGCLGKNELLLQCNTFPLLPGVLTTPKSIFRQILFGENWN